MIATVEILSLKHVCQEKPQYNFSNYNALWTVVNNIRHECIVATHSNKTEYIVIVYTIKAAVGVVVVVEILDLCCQP